MDKYVASLTMINTPNHGCEFADYLLNKAPDELKNKVYSIVIDSNLVLDLSLVEAIDSAGVGLIMAGFNDAEDNGHRLYIMNPSPQVRQAIEDTGFADTFYFIHSVTEVV